MKIYYILPILGPMTRKEIGNHLAPQSFMDELNEGIANAQRSAVRKVVDVGNSISPIFENVGGSGPSEFHFVACGPTGLTHEWISGIVKSAKIHRVIVPVKSELQIIDAALQWTIQHHLNTTDIASGNHEFRAIVIASDWSSKHQEMVASNERKLELWSERESHVIDHTTCMIVNLLRIRAKPEWKNFVLLDDLSARHVISWLSNDLKILQDMHKSLQKKNVQGITRQDLPPIPARRATPLPEKFGPAAELRHEPKAVPVIGTDTTGRDNGAISTISFALRTTASEVIMLGTKEYFGGIVEKNVVLEGKGSGSLATIIGGKEPALDLVQGTIELRNLLLEAGACGIALRRRPGVTLKVHQVVVRGRVEGIPGEEGDAWDLPNNVELTNLVGTKGGSALAARNVESVQEFIVKMRVPGTCEVISRIEGVQAEINHTNGTAKLIIAPSRAGTVLHGFVDFVSRNFIRRVAITGRFDHSTASTETEMGSQSGTESTRAQAVKGIKSRCIIANVHYPDLVIDVAGETPRNGAKVHLWSRHGKQNQQFDLEPLEDGTYRILDSVAGLVLDVAEAKTGNGSQIHLWNWTGSANQRWVLHDCQDGTFIIESCNGGRVLDADTRDQGRTLHLWDRHGTTHGGLNQRWKKLPLE